MLFRRHCTLFLLCLAAWSAGWPMICSGAAATGAASPAAAVPWRELRPGFDLAEISLAAAELALRPADADGAAAQAGADTGNDAAKPGPVVVALRIDPDRFTFTLHMASEEAPLPLPALAEKYGLLAAINAGMYLTDQKTSTGHLRSATHVNNPRVAGNFGAFFMAGPKKAGLPRVRLLDRAEDDWPRALEEYALVMQNYRMNTVQGRVIWKDDRPHSVAALSQDSAGRILFLLCAEPVPAGAFAAALLRRPLQLRTIMYLEGGSEAAMLVRAGDVRHVFTGRYAGGWGPSGSPDTVLPNVLGVRPRSAGE